MINKEQLKEIIKDLVEVHENISRELTSDRMIPFRLDYETLFKEACTYHRGMIANESKMGRNPTGWFNNQQKETKQPEPKATTKQIDFLYKLNADFDADTITKKQAMELIKKLTKKGEGDDKRANSM